MSTVFFPNTSNNKLGVRLFLGPRGLEGGPLAGRGGQRTPDVPLDTAAELQQPIGTQQESTEPTTGAEKGDLAQQLYENLQQGINSVVSELNQCQQLADKGEDVNTRPLERLIEILKQDVEKTKQAKQENPEMKEPANLEEAEKCILEATRDMCYMNIQYGIYNLKTYLSWCKERVLYPSEDYMNKEDLLSLIRPISLLEHYIEMTEQAKQENPGMELPENFEEAEKLVVEATKSRLPLLLQSGINMVKKLLRQYPEMIKNREPERAVFFQDTIETLKECIKITKQEMEANPEMQKPENLEEAENFIVEAIRNMWSMELRSKIDMVRWSLDKIRYRNPEGPIYLKEMTETLEQYVAMIEQEMKANPKMQKPENLKEAKSCIAEANKTHIGLRSKGS